MTKARDFLAYDAMLQATNKYLSLILVDLDTSDIIAATPEAHELFGYESDKLIGLQVDELVPPELRDRHKDLVHQYSEDPRVIQMGDRRLSGVKKDGTALSLTIWLIPTDPGQAMCVCFK
jgi:PAS domain S-box-containing protein